MANEKKVLERFYDYDYDYRQMQTLHSLKVMHSSTDVHSYFL